MTLLSTLVLVGFRLSLRGEGLRRWVPQGEWNEVGLVVERKVLLGDSGHEDDGVTRLLSTR